MKNEPKPHRPAARGFMVLERDGLQIIQPDHIKCEGPMDAADLRRYAIKRVKERFFYDNWKGWKIVGVGAHDEVAM